VVWGLLLSALCAAGIWGYVLGVILPARLAAPPDPGGPQAVGSDLYTSWRASQEFLLHGADPYSPEVNRAIQTSLYGRPLDPLDPHETRDRVIMGYPIYVAFAYAPILGLPFVTAQWIVSLLFALITALSVPLWLIALDLRLPRAGIAILTLLALSSYAAVTGIMVQQPTIWAAFLLAAGCALLARGRLFWGGVVLACATIKPQLVAPLLAGLGVWALGDLRRRQGLAWGLGGALAVLVGAGEWLSPGWVPRWIAAAGAYAQSQGEGINPLVTWLGGPLAGVVWTALLLGGLTWAWWRAGREARPGPAFAAALALTLAITLLIVPLVVGYNSIILLPPLLLLVALAPRAWRTGGRGLRYAYLLLGLTAGWYWLAASGEVLWAAVAWLLGDVRQATTQSDFALYVAFLYVVPFVVPAVLALTLYRLRLPPWAESVKRET
jgi:hypothetical protein